jgi:hypothetical protein
MISILYIILIWIASSTANDMGFSKTGTLKFLEAFQQAVTDNSEDASSFALIYGNSSVVVGIRRYNQLVDTYQYTIHKEPITTCIIGWDPDVMATHRFINRVNIDHFEKYKTEILPEQLTLALADEVHSRTIGGSRPLAMNALLLGNKNIYKVDVTGNYWKCQAAAIGSRCVELEAWIGSRGIDLVSERMTLERESIKNDGIDKHFNDTEFCLDLAWRCLVDVLGDDLLKLSIDIATSSYGCLSG